METIFKQIKGFFNNLSELLLIFLSVGILVQVLFGGAVFEMGVDDKESKKLLKS